MNPLWNIPQFLMTAWLGKLTHEQQVKYQEAVDRQIAEGRSIAEARTRAMMGMVQNDPYTNESQAVLKALNQNLPAQVRSDTMSNLVGWQNREKDVMGYLQGIGTQAAKDTERTFGEEAGRVNSDLVSRGLSGGGVGASIAHGFATRKADELARIRENVGQLKAGTLAGLRADTQMARERGFNTAYGFDESTANAYANALANRGQTALDTYGGTTKDYLDVIMGVNNIPPNPAPFYQASQQLGYGLGNFH